MSSGAATAAAAAHAMSGPAPAAGVAVGGSGELSGGEDFAGPLVLPLPSELELEPVSSCSSSLGTEIRRLPDAVDGVWAGTGAGTGDVCTANWNKGFAGAGAGEIAGISGHVLGHVLGVSGAYAVQ